MNDTLVFAAVFLISIAVICSGVVMVALNRVGSASRARTQKRRSGYRHRAFKDGM